MDESQELIYYYYRYNERYELIEKSSEPLEGDNVVRYYEDIDIQLFRVVVGFISPDGEMLRHTKFIRDAEQLQMKLNEINQRQVESELETDFRLCMIELGVI